MLSSTRLIHIGNDGSYRKLRCRWHSPERIETETLSAPIFVAQSVDQACLKGTCAKCLGCQFRGAPAMANARCYGTNYSVPALLFPLLLDMHSYTLPRSEAPQNGGNS